MSGPPISGVSISVTRKALLAAASPGEPSNDLCPESCTPPRRASLFWLCLSWLTKGPGRCARPESWFDINLLLLVSGNMESVWLFLLLTWLLRW